jgi:hypothetical protein
MKNEEGSMLLSVLLFVSFAAFLVINVSFVIRNQSFQLRQTTYSYEAKSMIEVTKDILAEKQSAGETIENVRIHFSNGEVNVTQLSEEKLSLTVFLDDGFSINKTIVFP